MFVKNWNSRAPSLHIFPWWCCKRGRCGSPATGRLEYRLWWNMIRILYHLFLLSYPTEELKSLDMFEFSFWGVKWVRDQNLKRYFH